MWKSRSVLVAALLPFIFCACDGNGRPADFQQGGFLEGAVIKGPVAHATVQLKTIDGKTLLSTTETDETGAFKLPLASASGDFRVCASNGSFTDEASRVRVSLRDETLCSVVSDIRPGQSRRGFPITPFTDWTIARMDARVRLHNESFRQAYDAARRDVGELLGCARYGTDILDAVPKIDLVHDTPAPSEALRPDIIAGILLHGLSHQALAIAQGSHLTPGADIHSLALAQAISRDIRSDGLADGKAGNEPIILGNVALSSNTLRGADLGLAQGIRSFIREEGTQLAIAESDLASLTTCLATSHGALFGGNSGNILDTQGPRITLAVPNTEHGISGAFTLTVHAEDIAGVAQIKGDGLGNAFRGLSYEPSDMPQVAMWTVPIETNTMADAVYDLVISAKDRLGNASQIHKSIIVNNQAPRITTIDPAVQSFVSGPIRIAAEAQDQHGISNFTIEKPEGLVDINPLPNQVDAAWETTDAPEGPFVITLKAEDTQGQISIHELPIEIDNLKPSTWSGQALLETPITHGLIQAWSLDGTSRKNIIGASTSENGSFTIQVSDIYSGPTLLTISGTTTSFKSAATGRDVMFRPADELSLLIHHVPSSNGQKIDHLSINAWTTLATELALSLRRNGLGWSTAITRAHDLMGSHLRRGDGQNTTDIPIDIRFTSGINLLTPDPIGTEDEVSMTFSHVGLSRLAAEASLIAGRGNAGKNTMHLLEALRVDLEDNRFDGLDHLAHAIDITDMAKLSVETLRSDLAAEVLKWLNRQPLSDTTSGIAPPSWVRVPNFARPGGFLHDINSDTSELFGRAEPKPFDTEGPKIAFAGIPTDGFVRGDFPLSVLATDNAGVISVDILIAGYPHAVHPEDDMENIADYERAIIDTTQVTDGEHSVVVKATDAFNNTSESHFNIQVDNTPPTIIPVGLSEFVHTRSFPIIANINDGDHGSGVSSFKILHLGRVISTGTLNGSIASASVSMNACEPMVLHLVAEDRLGNRSELVKQVTCDDQPPEMVILGVTNGTSLPRTIGSQFGNEAAMAPASLPTMSFTLADLYGSGRSPVIAIRPQNITRESLASAEFRFPSEGFFASWHSMQQADDGAWWVPLSMEDIISRGQEIQNVVSIELRGSDRAGNSVSQRYVFRVNFKNPVLRLDNCKVHDELYARNFNDGSLQSLFQAWLRPKVGRCDITFDAGYADNNLARNFAIRVKPTTLQPADVWIEGVTEWGEVIDVFSYRTPIRAEACSRSPFEGQCPDGNTGYQIGKVQSCGPVQVGVFDSNYCLSGVVPEARQWEVVYDPTHIQVAYELIDVQGTQVLPDLDGFFHLNPSKKYRLITVLKNPQLFISGNVFAWGNNYGHPGSNQSGPYIETVAARNLKRIVNTWYANDFLLHRYIDGLSVTVPKATLEALITSENIHDVRIEAPNPPQGALKFITWFRGRT